MARMNAEYAEDAMEPHLQDVSDPFGDPPEYDALNPCEDSFIPPSQMGEEPSAMSFVRDWCPSDAIEMQNHAQQGLVGATPYASVSYPVQEPLPPVAAEVFQLSGTTVTNRNGFLSDMITPPKRHRIDGKTPRDMPYIDWDNPIGAYITERELDLPFQELNPQQIEEHRTLPPKC